MTFDQFLSQIESSTSWKFYFKQEWIKDIKVSADLDPPKFDLEMMDSLIAGTQLNYYREGNSLFLLDNRRIVEEFPILEKKETIQSQEVEESVLFLQERDNVELENQIIQVGNVRNYQRSKSVSVQGTIRSLEDGEPAGDVFIYSKSSSTISDSQGNFTIELPTGKSELFFQAVNMIDTKRTLMVYSQGILEVAMEPDIQVLREIEIIADRERNIRSADMGLLNIKAKEVKIVPALLGERDLIRVATLSAGIQNVGEGAAGINVRGGKADQNLFLLDGSTIYNTNHFFGFFNILNSDVISTMDLYKNGVPAKFGGRLSSVFDIRSKEPNMEKMSVEGGIGPVTTKLTAEIPYMKNKGSVLVGGRTTFSDFILDLADNSSISNNDVSFYDFIVKVNHKIDSTNDLSVTYYRSKDDFKLASDSLLSFSDFSYTNDLLSINWNHTFSNKLKGTLHAGHSRYNYGTRYDAIESQAFGLDYFIRETQFSTNFDYYINENVNHYFGLDWKYYKASPGERFPIGGESLINEGEIEQEQGMEFNAFFSTKYQLSDRLLLDFGVRYNLYNVLGPNSVNQYQSNFKSESTFQGEREYGNEVIKTYHGPELRLSSRYLLNDGSSIKASYNRSRQNQHLLINAASIAPTDVWRLSGEHIKPQIADQYSIGYYRNIEGKQFIELSVEAYYKDIRNLLDFRTGAELQFNDAVERDILQGEGQSYGVELSIRKPDGWLNGWLNYTYSRSFIKLDSDLPANRVNGGTYFPTGYDKPHYFNGVVNYKFTSRITMTTNLVYATGIPVTYPEGKWNFKGTDNILYSDRNEYRIPDYFRVDFGFNIDASHKLKKWTHSSWTFSLYNVLGRDNIYSIFFQVEEGEVRGYKLTVFENPIPTITYNFRF